VVREITKVDVGIEVRNDCFDGRNFRLEMELVRKVFDEGRNDGNKNERIFELMGKGNRIVRRNIPIWSNFLNGHIEPPYFLNRR
jgi:hypothetical protein